MYTHVEPHLMVAFWDQPVSTDIKIALVGDLSFTFSLTQIIVSFEFLKSDT